MAAWHDMRPKKAWAIQELTGTDIGASASRSTVSIHPHDAFLNGFDEAQQRQRMADFQKLQDQINREERRLGAEQMRERYIRDRCSDFENAFKYAITAASPQKLKADPSFNRKLLLLL